ncbi:TetR/AcrR family transcriptional regulator C-terminal domain-containing protein [Microtetraspora fusca]|uniref:TetR/AcrR family transcriptional regulator C-terminal domain-containing protein n=1 Tax=Microtetraspora fusca TaxID=1997 RepID=UPI000AF5C201|nr:TetR/AcrR family transcriptional regulator C-terminal domain-containing protein [Microtetraspora fusca]
MIARTALRLLNEVGLDGLSMRLVAKELEVRVSALYWHVRNKQQLLDAMAEVMFLDAVDGLEAPARGESWDDWLRLAVGDRMRRAMLRYRGGARVFAGTNLTHPALFRVTELVLRTLCAEGLTRQQAAQGFQVLYHFTVSYAIEEQARQGAAYDDENLYSRPPEIDATRYPLSAEVLAAYWQEGPDAGYADGVSMILSMLKTLTRG